MGLLCKYECFRRCKTSDFLYLLAEIVRLKYPQQFPATVPLNLHNFTDI
jgi:hypothetical protein